MPQTLQQAAAELGTHPQTLRRWVRDGAPVVQRGGRGRGRQALFDVGAIRAWRERSTAPTASYRVLAGELPELIADAVFDSFKAVAGPHKREVAGALAGVWYQVTCALLDHLRVADPLIPELACLPEKVSALRDVFAQSDNVNPSSTYRSR